MPTRRTSTSALSSTVMPAQRRGRGRRPTEEVRREVLAAAGDLLLEGGMRAFTIEGVAARAGASKVTIYKLWPSRGALALDGYFHRVGDTLRFPDTGDVETDLRTQLRAFAGLLLDTPAGTVVAELIGAAQTDPDLMTDYLQRYSTPRRLLAVDTLERARHRGQIRDDVDPQVVVDQLWGATYHRLLLPDPPLDLPFVDALLDNVLRGIRPSG